VGKRHLVKGEKYMEMYKAKLRNTGDKYYLELDIKDKKLLIPLNEDKPNDIKDVFNELIIKLKKLEYNFTYESSSNNIYEEICEEYIKQLNGELKVIRNELKTYDLII
jgi:hypothetical protein